MHNVEMKVNGAILTITVKLDAAGVPSKSGKSTVLATTGGFAPSPVPNIIVGLNVCRK